MTMEETLPTDVQLVSLISLIHLPGDMSASRHPDVNQAAMLNALWGDLNSHAKYKQT
jgi:hypothetical protein